MHFLRLIVSIVLFALLSLSAYCADYKIKDVTLDNSDRIIVIKGQGNFKTQANSVYAPVPTGLNILTDISKFTITNPARYVLDIPNATLIGSSRSYTLNNSNVVQNVQLSQFSVNPHVVRTVITLKNIDDAKNIKTFTNGTDIIVQYANNIIDNSIKYKFYTPTGDMDKSANPQDLSANLTYNNNLETISLTPSLSTKYYLGQISQSNDGLILRGIGAITLQRAIYNSDNTKAEIILDNANLSNKLDNKTYDIPSSNSAYKATLSINRINSRKIKLTLMGGDNLRDYRFIVSPDGQSLFVTHRSFVINTNFASSTNRALDYKITKNQNGYVLFDFSFLNPVAYDVFELNDNFYLDINNLSDYSAALFESALSKSDIKVQVLKISNDKTRYIIPSKELNFSYANVESNAKSITLCFKQKAPVIASNNKEVLISNVQTIENKSTPTKIEKQENINVIYVPKSEDSEVQKNKKPKDKSTISSLKRVVLDPGHGGSDTGAIGGGVYEKTINLDVANLIAEKLKKKNIHVYMTRDKDKTLTLEDRTTYSNEINPNIYVSIHVNSNVTSDPYGIETHYYKEDSYELAKTIQTHFASEKNLKKWETKDRGVIKSRFYVINHTEAPSVLIEIGFISNAIEREKLTTKQRQEEIAESIVKGILEYLK